MSYVITDECTSCGACEPECPINCITSADGKFVIDANACTDCGACVNVCPVDAIKLEQ